MIIINVDFNKEQLEAINSVKGTVQVIASAGSGKSTTLIKRIENMINNHNIKQRDILTISFTNASATDLEKKLKEKNIEEVTSGTFHSICKQLLSQVGVDTNTFPNKYQFKRELETKTYEKNINIEDVMSWINYQQAYGLTSEDNKFKTRVSVYNVNTLRKFYKLYEEFKKKTKCLDFGDWLTLTNKLYKEKKIAKQCEYLLIDEYQDSNLVQHELVKNFCSTDNIFVVGDEKQALYEFNGAVPELFQDFYKNNENTKVINLYTNYRSCNNIVQASNNFVKPYYTEYEYYKDAEAENKSDGVIETHYYPTKQSEAKNVVDKIQELHKEGIALEDIAIIYRNNATSDYVEYELKKRNIEYTSTSNGSFYDRTEIKGIISILKLIQDVTNDEAFETALNTRFYPLTYFKGTLLDDLKSEAGKKDVSLYEAFLDHRFAKSWEQGNANTFVDYINRFKIQKDKHLPNDKLIDNIIRTFKVRGWINERFEATSFADKIDGLENLKNISSTYTLEGFLNFVDMGGVVKTQKKKGVTLSTIHKSKGLEYLITFVIGLEDKKFPSERTKLDSEVRLFYVAITRAKERIYLSSIGDSKFYREYCNGVKSIEESN